MDSLQAHLLVAIPRLPDSNFYRTVVLMLHHDDEGAFGVILNRPSDISLSEVWNQLTGCPCEANRPINLGGPVEGPLIALHSRQECAENTIIPGVFLATQKDNLNDLVRFNDDSLRIYSGYSGWGKNQLEGEIEAGGWLTTKANADFIFGTHDDLWQSVADSIGQRIVMNDVKDRSMPDDPSMN